MNGGRSAGRVGLLAAAALVIALAGPALAAALDVEGLPKVFTCSACHGVAGASRSDSMPILAGMNQVYLARQIQAYATGQRVSPEMEPYGKYVLQVGIDEVTSYFARQRRAATPIKADPAAVERGRVASAPCVTCHGPAGRGNAAPGQGLPVVPSLAGQPPGYLRDQMVLFKQDRRNPGDQALKALKALMATIPDETFPDLAAYYSSLKP